MKSENQNRHNKPLSASEFEQLFKTERMQCKTDVERINKVVHKIDHENNLYQLSLMIFVRFWIALLQMGSLFYVATTERNIKKHSTSKR